MKKAIIMIAIIAVVVGLGYLLSRTSDNTLSGGSPAQTASPGLLVRSDSHQTNPGAKVTVVEFGDFQCPVCGAAYPVVKQITDQYQNNKDFNFVFRNFPLPQHQFAQLAAEAAEAAGRQGKFWQMYDKLYQNQNDWSVSANPLDLFVSYAQSIGLDANKFKTDVQNSAFSSKIQADMSDAQALGVDATPTFYINGVQFIGVPQQNFATEIANDLKK